MNKNEEYKRIIVEVSIEDLIETAQNQILKTYGGFGANDINRVSGLKFQIPDITEVGKCNDVLPAEDESDNACGTTGGSCICGEQEAHNGKHTCKLCGEEW